VHCRSLIIVPECSAPKFTVCRVQTLYNVLGSMGGATVLKVGDNFASGPSEEFFFNPHFLASGGDKYCLDLDSYKSV